jgi:uncharacterized protein with beta-barrel porin domain
MDALSGEGLSGTQETAFSASNMFLSAMMDQGVFWRKGDPTDVNGVSYTAAPVYDPAASERSKQPVHGTVVTATPVVFQPRWRAWLTGFGGTWKLNGEAGIGSASLSHNTGGGAAGLDYQFAPDMLGGLAFGGSSSNFSVPDRSTSGHLEGGHLGAYGEKTWGALYAAGAVSFSMFHNSTTRTIAGVGPTEGASADFSSNLFSSRLEGGWKQAYGWLSATPFAAVQISELWQNGFTESSAPLPGAGVLGLSESALAVTSL